MSDQSGLIETIQDAISVHSIKKQGAKLLTGDQKTYSLVTYFYKVLNHCKLCEITFLTFF